jgi:hypothetical protein
VAEFEVFSSDGLSLPANELVGQSRNKLVYRVQICTINPKSPVDDLFQLVTNGSAISLNRRGCAIQRF